MGNHRQAWKPMFMYLANIFIAATGVGLLVMAAKFLATGDGLFARAPTERQKKTDEIKMEIQRLSGDSIRC